MRNFNRTTEPRGGSQSASKRPTEQQLPFVIQKHAASRLHYDFRLGWRGVLKSWAVAKGPSYVPAEKRLAIQVEDHPVEYGGFEGVIPKGQYGGGTVMLWDQGTWEPIGDVEEGFRKGRLKFTLHGKKLRGDWALIRMDGKAAEEKKPNWLLIKEHDANEHGPGDPPITEEEPDSVVTGRDLREIEENQDHVWESQGSRKQEDKSGGARVSQPAVPHRTSGPDRSKAPKEALPKFVSPQLALAVKKAPEGAEWLHELKLDGYRMQARIDRRSRRNGSSPVTLMTRGGLDWTDRMKGVARSLLDLPLQQALLDGEVVVFDKQGRSSFARLQASFQDGQKQEQTYVVFDLLHLDGHNLRGLPLEGRKEILEKLFAELPDHGTIRFGEHLRGSGKEIFQKACKLGAEGIVSKRASSAYVSARNGSWLKIKCIRGQEFVIGGFTPPSKGGVGIGALLLGYYRDGELIYAGRTGTGFTQKVRRDLRVRLDKLVRSRTSFASLPSGASHQAKWVEPKLVCEVNFATWTADRLVRQASFQGLCEDKPAKSVGMEIPVEPEKVRHRSESEETRKWTRAENDKAAVSNASGKRRNAARASSNGNFPIPLTHPDKVVDSETRLTKRELADYFWAVREHMMPYISERPLSVVRCPRGSTEPCFFQKHVTGTLPHGVEGIEIRERRNGKAETYLTLSTPLGLAGLAQMGVLEIHPWGSSNRDIERPNLLVFDLDPDSTISWPTLADAARELRSRLRRCKLESFLKTTGGKGLHVVAPIEADHEWPVVKEFARALAVQMESENPRLYVTNMTKAARKGKIYLDYLRNDRGATSIAPYSPRARSGAPVALPVVWNELDSSKAPRLRVNEFKEWKQRLRRDPWEKFFSTRQSLTATVLEQVTSG